MRLHHRQELRGEYDEYERDGVGRGVRGGDVVRLGRIDQRAERRGGGHAARNGAEVVEQAQLDEVTRDEEAQEHRDDFHNRAVDEQNEPVLRDVLDEAHTARNAGADKEEDEPEFAERLEEVAGNFHADRAEPAEVTEDQAHNERAARIAEGEVRAARKRNVNFAKENAEQNRKRERTEPDRIELEKIFRQLAFDVLFVGGAQELLFFGHIGAEEFRNELDEENDADDPERIADRVADRAAVDKHVARGFVGHVGRDDVQIAVRLQKGLARVSEHFVRGGETGRGREGAGENTDRHGAVDAREFRNRGARNAVCPRRCSRICPERSRCPRNTL